MLRAGSRQLRRSKRARQTGRDEESGVLEDCTGPPSGLFYFILRSSSSQFHFLVSFLGGSCLLYVKYSVKRWGYKDVYFMAPAIYCLTVCKCKKKKKAITWLISIIWH